MADATSGPEGSDSDHMRKFREALERKREKQADRNGGRRTKESGPVHGADGPAQSRRSFRRKTGG